MVISLKIVDDMRISADDYSGIGASVPLGLGAATICDLFTQGERGLWMGVYTLSITNGPHIAPIAGGFIAQRLGWRYVCL